MIATTSVELTHIIPDIVEAMLPPFSGRKLGLHMVLDMRYDDHGYDKSGNKKVRPEWKKRYYIEFIFVRSSNYTLVLGEFFGKDEDKNSEKFYPVIRKEKVLKQLSYHDSCWIHDGFNYIFSSFMDAVDTYSDDHDGDEDLRDHLSTFHGFDIFHGQPKYVKLKTLEMVDPNNRYTSDYRVVIDKELTIKEAAEYMPEVK